jgi:hypothetical protein
MALTIVTTPGAANANSFATKAEVDAYYEARLPVPEWEAVASEDATILMAARYMVAMFAPLRKLIRMTPPAQSYYLLRPTWTGAPSTTTQALPWPRTGMYDINGNAIASTVIPQELKNAQAEFAIQLAKGDRTIDNDVALQGITSVKAGSVAVTFKNAGIDTTVIIPDAVWGLLVPSWLTDEQIEYANQALFDVVSC